MVMGKLLGVGVSKTFLNIVAKRITNCLLKIVRVVWSLGYLVAFSKAT